MRLTDVQAASATVELLPFSPRLQVLPNALEVLVVSFELMD